VDDERTESRHFSERMWTEGNGLMRLRMGARGSHIVFFLSIVTTRENDDIVRKLFVAMETLGQIKSVADKIRMSSRPAYAVYRLVFEKDGDRTTRNQLRNFSGFDFDDTSDKFRAKLEYSAAFSVGDLTSMCNILGLE